MPVRVVALTEATLVEGHDPPHRREISRKILEIRSPHPVPVQGKQRLSVAAAVKKREDEVIVFKAAAAHGFSFRFHTV